MREGGSARADAGEVDETLWCTTGVTFLKVVDDYREWVFLKRRLKRLRFRVGSLGSDFDGFPRGHAMEQESFEHLGA